MPGDPVVVGHFVWLYAKKGAAFATPLLTAPWPNYCTVPELAAPEEVLAPELVPELEPSAG